jgi:hypothetical protein
MYVVQLERCSARRFKRQRGLTRRATALAGRCSTLPQPGRPRRLPAMRFTEPGRTSPTAAPGTPVSNSPLAPSASLPVSTKPLGSRRRRTPKANRVWVGADEKEQWRTVRRMCSPDRTRHRIASSTGPLPSRPLICAWVRTSTFETPENALDEMVRHLRSRARAADEEPGLSHLGLQINQGLTGRVAAADQRHLSGAQLCLEGRSPTSSRPPKPEELQAPEHSIIETFLQGSAQAPPYATSGEDPDRHLMMTFSELSLRKAVPVWSLLGRPPLRSLRCWLHHATAAPVFTDAPPDRSQERLAPHLDRHPHRSTDPRC